MRGASQRLIADNQLKASYRRKSQEWKSEPWCRAHRRRPVTVPVPNAFGYVNFEMLEIMIQCEDVGIIGETCEHCLVDVTEVQ